MQIWLFLKADVKVKVVLVKIQWEIPLDFFDEETTATVERWWKWDFPFGLWIIAENKLCDKQTFCSAISSSQMNITFMFFECECSRHKQNPNIRL